MGLDDVLEHLRKILTMPADKPELNRATYDSLRILIPLMYVIISISVYALSWTHWQVAPRSLTLIAPAFFTIIVFYRSYKFITVQSETLSDSQILSILNRTIAFGSPFGALFLVWEFMLLQHSDSSLIPALMFFTGVSTITMSLCMTPLKPSAIILTLLFFPTNAIFMFLTNDPVLLVVGINLIAVGGALLVLIEKQNRDFKNLVEQQVLHREQKSKLQQLNLDNMKIANTDALTGLPNRRFFFQALDLEIAESSRLNAEFVVILLDLDGFKPVNDLFGHPAGDALLQAVAKRLNNSLGEDVLLSRLGGDEFGIILRSPGDDEAVLAVCLEVSRILATPFKLKEGTANIAGTIGVARFPQTGQSSRQLFERADYALCYSKQHSKGEPIFFSRDHEKAIRDLATLEQRLREADLEQELYVVFQPIMNTQLERVESFEALARWRSPVMGDVSPEEFIRSAEQTGLITKMSVVLLKKALSAAVNWPSDIKLSFNLSAVNLSSQASVRELIRQIEAFDFPPSRLIFEITESAVMQDYERVISALGLLRRAGAMIALDDFGTGFSSLSYIQKLPLDRVKIDRSFISDIEHDFATRKIVESIAVLCRNLNLDCVVEGVETSRQMDMIHRMGFINIQGYLFSKPLSSAHASEYVDTHNSDEEIAWLSA